jgi:hypothetical protein
MRSTAAFLLRSGGAPQHFSCADFFVVVMTTAISKYYFSERFF